MKAISRIQAELNHAGAKVSDNRLIVIDYKVIIVCFATLLLFLLFLGFKVHASSIPYWNTMIPYEQEHQDGLMIGTPKAIRSDEWTIVSTFALSQAQLGFPVRNENLGANSDPLLMSLPVRHFSSLFRPQNWGYFVFGIERGFSFNWAFKIFGLGLSFFFLLMLVTGNRFGLSLFGSFWLFFSSFIQWWFSSVNCLPELITSFSVVFISLAYLFLAKRRLDIVISLILFIVFSINFVLVFYPPFQITLAYLLFFLLAGLFLERSRRERFKRQLKARLLLLGSAVAVVLIVFYRFYIDAKSTIDAITATSYPGSRRSTGGGMSLINLFAGFSLAPLNEHKFPSILGNACGASNFILLFPAVFLVTARNVILRIKNSPLILMLLAYLFLQLIWALVGLPASIAELTLLNRVPGRTTGPLLGIGIASIIISMVYLSQPHGENRDRRFIWGSSAFIFVGLLLFELLLKKEAGDYLGYRFLIPMAIGFAFVSFLFLTRRKALFTLAIVLVLIPSYLVNPLSSGLDPIFEKEVAKAAVQLQSDSPDSKWVVYGNHQVSSFLKALGLNVFNGVKYTPDLKSMQILDPQQKYIGIYNNFGTGAFAEPIDAGDKEIKMYSKLETIDNYTVYVDPCSDELERIGIDLFAFTYRPDEKRLSCLSLIREFESSNIWFYQRRS